MTDDIYSMTKSGFHEAIRQAQEDAWDRAYRKGIDDILLGETNVPSPNPYRPAL